MPAPETTGEACFPLVAAEVRAAIADAGETPAFRALLTRLLARPGRLLAPRGPAKWPAFVLETCQALGGDRAAAAGAAAAVEFAVAAADVVDDLVDDEWPGDAIPWGRALNGGGALAWLAQRTAQQLAGPIGVERAHRVGGLLAGGYLAAAAGEDLDLRLEAMPAATEDLAHEMTRRKSGALVAMACRVGAAVAVDEPRVLDAVGRFGEHVGVVAQLLNDLAGVDPAAPERGSDLRRGKKTLPVAFALRCAREECLPAFPSSSWGGWEEAALAAAIRDLGGLHYTWVVADAHRREALAALRALAALTGREEVRDLRRLIPPARARRAWRPA